MSNKKIRDTVFCRYVGTDENLKEVYNIMKDYLLNNEREVIDMFGFEWNADEEREALLETGEARGLALGKTQGEYETLRSLLADGAITMDYLKSTGRYTSEQLLAIAKP